MSKSHAFKRFRDTCDTIGKFQKLRMFLCYSSETLTIHCKATNDKSQITRFTNWIEIWKTLGNLERIKTTQLKGTRTCQCVFFVFCLCYWFLRYFRVFKRYTVRNTLTSSFLIVARVEGRVNVRKHYRSNLKKNRNFISGKERSMNFSKKINSLTFSHVGVKGLQLHCIV